MNRESYLINATKRLAKSVFAQAGIEVPSDVKVTCGFPVSGGAGSRKRTIGQCFNREASKAGVNEIFISPTISNTYEVLGTLIHELVHAVDDCVNGHRGEFVRIADAVGLVGKPTQCGAEEGTELWTKLEKYIAKYGEYPHEELMVETKTQGTRMIKIECSCGFKVRASRKVIEEIDPEHLQCWSCGETSLQIGG